MRRTVRSLLGLTALAMLGAMSPPLVRAEEPAGGSSVHGRESIRTPRGEVFVYRGEVERQPERGASPGGFGRSGGDRDAWYYSPGVQGDRGFYGYGGGYYDGGAYDGRWDRRGGRRGIDRSDRAFAPSIVPRFMEPPRRGPWVGVPARARVPFDRRSNARWR